MIITMILIFVFGYLCIALEHKLRIDKAAIALLMCGILWSIFSLEYPSALPGNDAQIGTQLIEQLGDTSEILFFLIGAMTIVELIDRHGGFHVITDTTSKPATNANCFGCSRSSPSSCPPYWIT